MLSEPESDDVRDAFATLWPRLVATLVREVGDVGLAEDCVQEAFASAATAWAGSQTPDRPGAWLLAVARHKSIDHIRRSARLRELLPVVAAADRDDLDGAEMTTELLDDQLRLVLGCCHPALSVDAQVALTLRIVAGLSTRQIASAFFVSEPTMTRRLTRAKTKIREAKIPFTRSDRQTLEERLPTVCAVIYSIFTEGHASASAATLMRGDLCDEAVWLATLVAQLTPDEPEVSGLLALLLLIDARRATRTDSTGRPVLLADQDRTRWDRVMIARGLAVLGKAHAARLGGPYQYQAAIAALHATAPSFEVTDWAAIVGLYDVWVEQWPAAVVELNRAVALSYARGPQSGFDALEEIGREDLAEYVYFHSTRAELLTRLARDSEAIEAFRRALALSVNDAERRHLDRRLAQLS